MTSRSGDELKHVIGRIGSALMPVLRRRLRDGDFASGTAAPGRLMRYVAKAEFSRLLAEGRTQEVQTALTRRWMDGKLANNYYDQFAERFEKLLSGPHAVVLDWMSDLHAARPIAQVVEVGCGDGRALTLAAERMPTIRDFLGIDINNRIIDRNRVVHSDKLRLSFHAGDATEWFARNGAPGQLLMTIGGVMEYMAPETLSGWFKTIVARQGAGVVLVEPLDPAHDLERRTESYTFGAEQSFSHNYVALLVAAGLRVRKRQETRAVGTRWLMLLATVPGRKTGRQRMTETQRDTQQGFRQ